MSRNSKKQNNANKDIIAVLFIFAVMILAAIGLTMCGRDEIDINIEKNGTEYEKKEEDNSGQIVIMTAAGVAVVIVICFAVKKAKDAERRNRAIREHNERMEEKRRIEEARERVRQARLQEMIDAGIRQLTENDKKRNRVIRRGSATDRKWDDEFDSYDLNDKRLNSYYRDKFDDDDLYEGLYDDEVDVDDEPETLIEKIKCWISNLGSYWWIIIGVVSIAVVGGIVIMIFAL